MVPGVQAMRMLNLGMVEVTYTYFSQHTLLPVSEAVITKYSTYLLHKKLNSEMSTQFLSGFLSERDLRHFRTKKNR